MAAVPGESFVVLDHTKLTHAQLEEALTAITTALLVYETGGDWRIIFLKRKNKYPYGYIHRLYKRLSKLSDADLEKVSASITEGKL